MYPRLTKVVFGEIRRVTLGEFMDDLEIGKKVSKIIGLPQSDDLEEIGAEKVGRSRLGPDQILNNMGVTLVLMSLTLVFLILLVMTIFYCVRHYKVKYPKCY